MTLNSVTVFCGSSSGFDPEFTEDAIALGRLLAKEKINLVYGGAKIGIMGSVAQATLDAGGTVTGIIPGFLSRKEVVHDGLTKLIIVNSMHERKLLMNHSCDAFITLPGGLGTMEELFEVLTWAQLGLHGKPVVLLNTHGYYNALIEFIHTSVQAGFLKPEYASLLITVRKVEDIFPAIHAWVSPEPVLKMTDNLS